MIKYDTLWYNINEYDTYNNVSHSLVFLNFLWFIKHFGKETICQTWIWLLLKQLERCSKPEYYLLA